MARPLPRKLRILGICFKVKRPRKLSMPGKEGNLACVDDLERVVEVAKGVSDKAAWDGFLHEWGHAVLSMSGTNQKISEELEEAIAQSISTGIQELLPQLGVNLYED